MRTILALAIALAGCRSSAINHYTLVRPAPATPPRPDLVIDVLPVEVPADVDRSELVVRRSNGEVDMVESKAWISPLAYEIQRATADEIARALPAVTGTFEVKLVVKRFESILDARATIDVAWTVKPANGDEVACSSRSSERATGGYRGLVEAHQRALGHVAADIAKVITSIDARPAGSPLAIKSSCLGAAASASARR